MQQSSGQSPAETYERYLVPRMFAPWVPDLLELANLKQGERVLDVACGTGIVARHAVKHVGEDGQVVGLDINKGMLNVASALEPLVDWQEGNAMEIPFSEGRFNAVFCQQGLQFCSNRRAAVREMHRVLAPGGRIIISAWFPLEQIPGHLALSQGLARHVSDEAAGLMQGAFSLGDSEELENLLLNAGFDHVDIRSAERIARFPSSEDFTKVVAVGSVIGRSGITISNDSLDALLIDVNEALQPYIDSEGLAFPMKSHLAVAIK